MKKTLTIAIPVYNMENLLPRCLDSILKARGVGDVEILVINDGSKDESLRIAKEYEADFPESVIAIDKENGGWGSVINLALEKASGKYFKILDSDDWFDTNSFERLIEILKTAEADIVATSYTKVYDDADSKTISYSESVCGDVLDFEQRLAELNYKTDIPMATLCYKTEILKEIGLKVADKYYADVEYALVPLCKVKTIQYLDLNVYQYYLGREDHSTSAKGYIAHFRDYLEITKKLVLFLEQSKIQGNVGVLLKNEIQKHVRFAYYLLLSTMFVGGSIEAKSSLTELDNYLKEHSSYLYKQAGKETVRGFIPFIKIWRQTGINVLNLRKWI